MAHQLTVGVSIEMADGKPLHMGEQIRANLVQSSRGDVHHEPAVYIGRQGPRQINASHESQHADKPGKIRVFMADKRHDVYIDQWFEKISSRNAGRCADYYPYDHQRQLQAVAIHIGKDSLNRLFCILRFGHSHPAPMSRSCHVKPPPSAGIRRLPCR